MSDHKDYSATPLWRKLGIKEGARVLCTRAPEGFADELQRLARLPDGVEFLRRPGRDVHVAITFVTRRSDLAARFPSLARSLAPAGRLWIAWPKKAAGVPTELDFDSVQRVGLDAGLVDNKSASIIKTYQGLQFVVRVRDRRA